MSGHEGIVPQEGARSERRMQEEKRLDSWVQGRLLETAQGAALVGVNVKDGVELCELKQIVHLLGQVEKFQLAAAAFRGRESADELADAGAINVIDVREIEHDFGAFVVKQAADRLAQQGAALAQGNLSAEVHHCGLTGISVCCA